MAGGYDGSQEYPEPTDLKTTLKLANEIINEAFENGGVVSFHVMNYSISQICHLATFPSYPSHLSHIAWLGWMITPTFWLAEKGVTIQGMYC